MFVAVPLATRNSLRTGDPDAQRLVFDVKVAHRHSGTFAS